MNHMRKPIFILRLEGTPGQTGIHALRALLKLPLCRRIRGKTIMNHVIGLKIRLDRPVDRERPCCRNICTSAPAKDRMSGSFAASTATSTAAGSANQLRNGSKALSRASARQPRR
jgi:hypothetical protein